MTGNAPARVSCAHHFGRSAAYAGMRLGAKVESIEGTGQYERDLQSCPAYRLDRPKAWRWADANIDDQVFDSANTLAEPLKYRTLQ